MSFAERYSVWSYGEMISDRVRMDAYTAALREAVKPGAVVVDIGTGTGVFAMLACQFGARKVYAIEPSVSIQVAQEIATANGLADRIEFINDLSTNLTLPERADVVISDLRSVLPFFQHHFASIADARRRLLKPDGVLIPAKDRLRVALVSDPEQYRRIVGPYVDSRLDFDMSATLRYVTNEWRKAPRLDATGLFLAPKTWLEIDYATWDQTDALSEVSWEVDRSETVNGFCLWFDAELADGIGFTNAPGQPALIYGRAYFPWTTPVELSAGDHVSITLSTRLQQGQYVWSWRTKVASAEADKASFTQSTFLSAPLSLAQLRKRSEDHVPNLNPRARIHEFILQQMAGGDTLGAVARRVQQQFPEHLPDLQAALHEVADVAERYEG